MRSFAVISIFASVALAQTSLLIPTGISDACTTFLNAYNTDDSLAGCTAPLISATSSILTSSSPSQADRTAALSAVCGSSAQCSQPTVRSKLADFYTACNAELTTALNEDVVGLYDSLYSIVPLQESICSKDDNGNLCVGTVASSITPSSLYTAEGSGSQSVLKPNIATIKSNNIAFLLLQTSTPEASLCTACVRNILTSYVSWESSSPYAPGLANSEVLAGQTDLYNAVVSTCGTNFLQGAVQAAGTLSGGILSGAAPRTVSVQAGGLSALLGAVTIAMAVAL